jgi:arylsulfatase A-like enzyme
MIIMNKHALFALATTLTATFCTSVMSTSEDAKTTKPNIVMFLVDDMGWQDTSVPFWNKATPLNQKFHTPNMERLAAQGMKFTQAYACPVCSPSRVSLMTGLNAARHRVTNWTLYKNKVTDQPHPHLQFPLWNSNGLQPTSDIPRAVCAPTLPHCLGEAGYRTIMVGKAHFGALNTPGENPKNLGFDVNIAGHAAGGPGSYLGEQNYSARFRKGDPVWDVPDLDHYHGTDTFLTEALTIEALKAVDQSRADKKPFFLYLSHYAVHVPYAPDKRFIEKYKARGLDNTEAMYAALVEGMDKSLGDLLDYLEKNKLAENTVVFFMSDNGGLSNQGRGGKPDTHNLPLSRGKGSPREGGIREPMLVKWPGVTQPGSLCNDTVIIEDFFTTILEIAGTRPAQPVDGVSFVPLLKGESGISKDRPLVWHQPNNWGTQTFGYGASSAVRINDWKYIFYHNPGQKVREELFNLREDIGETNNLVEIHLEKRKELRKILKDYLTKVDAQMPTDKKTSKLIEIPHE